VLDHLCLNVTEETAKLSGSMWNGEVRGTMSVWYGVVWYDVVCLYVCMSVYICVCVCGVMCIVV